MKIKIEARKQAKVYIQRYDLYFLANRLDEIPKNLALEISSFINGKAFFLGPLDGVTFDVIIENPENVEWIMSQDYILDYRKYSSMPKRKLKSLQKELSMKYGYKIEEFGFKSSTYRLEHFYDFGLWANEEKHRIQSIELMLDFNSNKVRFVFPEELSKVL